MITVLLEHDHQDEDLYLVEFRFAYNMAYHTSLQVMPAFLNFGREPLSVSSRREAAEFKIEIEETATVK